MTVSLRRFQLRERTSAAHRRVDNTVGGFSDLPSYKRYLSALYAFRAPLEAALSADWSTTLGTWRPGQVSPAIAADLADLDVTPPKLTSLPRPADRAALLGTLYVLEGASLGARVLLQRAEALGLSAEFGARHLAQQAARQEQWRGFLEILDGAPDLDIERASIASLATFARAARAFEGA